MANFKKHKDKRSEVGNVIHASRRAFIGIAVFSAFINILMLTGPIYMLQVYDRVLVSGSISTLVALTILMGALYLFMGLLEFVRSRVLVRVGNQVQEDLGDRTFGVWLTQGLYGKLGARQRPLDDLSALKNFFSSAALSAIFDIPWAPLFIAVIWWLHWVLGLIALIGAILIFTIALINELTTRKDISKSRAELMRARKIADEAHSQSDSIVAMGMQDNIRMRWNAINDAASGVFTKAMDRSGNYTSMTKALRMFFQSLVLGVGCGLAVFEIITPGGMIAGSIIMGRALAPIQMAIGQWKSIVGAREAYHRLNQFYDAVPETEDTLQLPEPKGELTIAGLVAAPPGTKKAVLSDINFAIKPGDGLGVIGPSASGKSTLARLLVGVWMPQRGSVRLDGASYDQWDRTRLGPYIGYLPQDVELLKGSVSDNISRFDPRAEDSSIVTAAQAAGVHEMILQFPKGYETEIGPDGVILSGGQVQRIALARALYGNPSLIVMDEPNANLDSDGDNALTMAIKNLRESGKTVVVMTHRPSAIVAVNKLLYLRGGRQIEFGEKDKVLAAISQSQAGAHSGGNVHAVKPKRSIGTQESKPKSKEPGRKIIPNITTGGPAMSFGGVPTKPKKSDKDES